MFLRYAVAMLIFHGFSSARPMPLIAENNQRYGTLVLIVLITFHLTSIYQRSSLHIGKGFAVNTGHKEKQSFERSFHS